MCFADVLICDIKIDLSWLPPRPRAVARPQVQALLDSPLWLDIDPLSSAVVSLQNETQAVRALPPKP